MTPVVAAAGAVGPGASGAGRGAVQGGGAAAGGWAAAGEGAGAWGLHVPCSQTPSPGHSVSLAQVRSMHCPWTHARPPLQSLSPVHSAAASMEISDSTAATAANVHARDTKRMSPAREVGMGGTLAEAHEAGHRCLSVGACPFELHDADEMGPRMLARSSSRAGRPSSDLWTAARLRAATRNRGRPWGRRRTGWSSACHRRRRGRSRCRQPRSGASREARPVRLRSGRSLERRLSRTALSPHAGSRTVSLLPSGAQPLRNADADQP
jgi:hypothetical protein